VAFNAYDAKFQITAGVVGTDALDRFNVKLATVGKTADNINRNMAALTSGLGKLGAAFGIQQLVNMTAELARTTIQIEAFQKQLSVGFGTNSTFELEKLRTIMRDLGISQEMALGSAVRFTTALKLSGQTMTETNKNFEAASKLILSNKLTAEGAQRVYYALAQTASKGKLMSEELNGQLGDVLAGFTQQVAIATGRGEGLAKAMSEGKVSADEFFTALVKISDGIDANSLESSAQSLGKVQNAIFEFKASILDSGQIKAFLDGMASSINFLRDNMSTLISVAKELGIILGVSFMLRVRGISGALVVLRAELAAMTAYMTAFGLRATFAATASINFSRALAGLGVAARAALAFVGGPLGLALIGVASAAYGVSSAMSEAKDRMDANVASAKALGAALTIESRWAEVAAEANKDVGVGAAGAEPKIWSLKKATEGLTGSLYEQAKAARMARIEILEKQLADNKTRYEDAASYTKEGISANLQGVGEALGQSDFLMAGSKFYKGAGGLFLGLASGGRLREEGERDRRQAATNIRSAEGQLEILRATMPTINDLPKGRPTGANDNEGGGDKKSKGGKAPSGPSEVQIAKSYEDMRDSIAQDTLRARADLSQSATERAQLERMALASDVQQRLADISAAKNLSDTQKFELVAELAGLQLAQGRLISARERAATARDAAAIEQDSVDIRLEELRFQQGMATSIAERTRIARDILAAEIKLERLKQEEVRDNETLSPAERDQARRALANLPARQARGERQISYENRSALEQYGEEVRTQTDNINEAMDNVRLTGIKSLEEGLSSVLTGTKSVASAFRDMAQSIISDLLKIAIRAAIIRPLMSALGIKGFADGGMFEDGVEKFANGGVVTGPTMFPMARGVGLMGEAGPEAIMPLRRGSDGRLGVEASGGGGNQSVVVNVNVEAGTQQSQGDPGKAAELGKLVANVVRAELVQQKRPGGLLAA
jgi:tape measure domain-containing protein